MEPLFLIIPTTIIFSVLVFYFTKKIVLHDLAARNKALTTLRKLDEIMMASLSLDDVSQKVTDAIAYELGFNIGVLALIDEKMGVLRRVAISRTKSTGIGKNLQNTPFEKTQISLSENRNLGIKAIKNKSIYSTDKLYDLLIPSESEETASKIQEIGNIKSSWVFPVFLRGIVAGVMIFSLDKSAKKLSLYEIEMMKKLIDVVGIALDNALVYGQLREATQKLGQANQRLQELDQLKDDFVSVASHELRTPMTAIRAYVWMALNKPDVVLTEKMKKYLSRTLISTERLINLVNDMLNVSRIESGRIEIKPESFNIVAKVKEIIEEVAPKAQERGLKISVLESQTPEVFADSDKVHQVLLNLVGNSLKFTPQGGEVSISFFTDGKVVETTVKDSGPGMTKEDLGRLFQKFGRLDNSYVAMGTSGGTGLGLFISKKLVELMHGKIWANSPGLGKGASFTFSLPIEKYQVQPVMGETKSLEPVVI